MPTETPDRLRVSSTTGYTLSADEIHVRAGGTSGAVMDFNDTDVANLSHPTALADTPNREKNFQQFFNKFKVEAANFSGSLGFDESISLGSCSCQIMAGSQNSGWYWGATGRQAKIVMLLRSSTNVFFFKPVVYNPGQSNDGDLITTSTQGWTKLTFRAELPSVSDLLITKSYASHNSSTGQWTWSTGSEGERPYGTGSSALTRFVEII
jgi:hypothetical protein